MGETGNLSDIFRLARAAVNRRSPNAPRWFKQRSDSRIVWTAVSSAPLLLARRQEFFRAGLNLAPGIVFRREPKLAAKRATCSSLSGITLLMKSRLLFVLAVVAALVTGFILGHFQVSRSLTRYMEHTYAYLPASTHIFETVKALTALHAGRQSDGLQTLELSLSESLLMFDNFDSVPQDQRDGSLLQSIRIARDYRAAHPFTEPFISNSNAIQQVFMLTK
jgi:hypothetical protein